MFSFNITCVAVTVSNKNIYKVILTLSQSLRVINGRKNIMVKPVSSNLTDLFFMFCYIPRKQH